MNKKIPLAKIRFDDFRYSVWAFSDYSAVKESIKQDGVVHDPIVVRVKGGEYCVAAGQKRLRSCRDLGYEEVMCKVIAVPKRSCQLLFNMAVENISFREYNLVEKSMIYNRLRKAGFCGKPMEKLCANLGINRRNALSIQELEYLPVPIGKAIGCGKLTGKAALGISGVSKRDQSEFLKLIQNSSFSHSRQFIVLSMLKDVCARDKISFRNLLSNKQLSERIRQAEESGSPVSETVHNWLINRMLPSYSRHKMEFQRMQAEAKPPKSVRIPNPQQFEGDSLNFVVSARKPKDLETAGRFLSEISKSRNIRKFLDLGIGVGGDFLKSGRKGRG